MPRELKEKYLISIKHNTGSASAPVFQKWKNMGTFDSLEEITEKYLNLPKHRLVKEKGCSSKIYTFEIIPIWGSHEGDKWKAYEEGTILPEYCHIRVKPILSLEESKTVQEVNEYSTMH